MVSLSLFWPQEKRAVRADLSTLASLILEKARGRPLVVLPPFSDEFNQKLIANQYCSEIRKTAPHAFVVAIDRAEFGALYPHLDLVVLFERSPSQSLEFDPKVDDSLQLEAIVSELSQFAELTPRTEAFLENLRNGLHVYKSLFSWQTRSFLEACPVRLDFADHGIECTACFRVNEFRGGRPTVTVIGRRLRKIPSINNALTFFKCIALICGFRVADLTAPTLGHEVSIEKFLERAFPKRYLSLSRLTGDYSCWINSMLASRVVILTGNAGGVSTHIQVPANLLIVGKGGWVDNAEFGAKGLSMIEARRIFWSNITTHHFKYFAKIRATAELLHLRLRED